MTAYFLPPFESYNTKNTFLEIKCADYFVRISAFSHRIIKVNISRSAQANDFSFASIQTALPFNFSVNEDATHLFIYTNEVQIRIKKNPFSIAFLSNEGKFLQEDDERFPYFFEGQKFTNYKKYQANERFIGLGEKTGNLDRKGSNYTHWNTDNSGYAVNADPLYKTIPFYIGIHSDVVYGLFLDNTHKSFFDFASSSNNELMWFGAEGGDLNYFFFAAQIIPQIIEDYTWLTGRMEMPPLWSLGYQQCRWSYHPDTQVLEIVKKFREKQIPIDVIYLDIDYMQHYKMFTWSSAEFPEPMKFIQKLNEQHIQVVTILDPGIKIEEGYAAYNEGVQKNYFAQYPNGENYIGEVWPGACHFPNFFSEEVKKWWGNLLSALSDVGVQGFWNDMNEPATWGQNIPNVVKFGDYYMPEASNVYGMQMAQATQLGAKKLLHGKRPFILTRAAYAGIQRSSAVWTGDNLASDEHLLLGQRLINSLGLAGIAFAGVDVGGFLGEPSIELMVRWNSLGVYMPMFRNHASSFSKFHEPWQFGEYAENAIKKDIEWRYQLLPYLYSYFYQASQTGLPICRTLAIYYPFVNEVYDSKYQNQFLFGDFILVAPAQSFELEKEVWLPEGNWYRLSNQEKLDGNTCVIVASPLHDLPVFVKESGIVITQNIIQHTAEISDGILYISLYHGAKISEFMYYEDDGNSYQYQDKQFYKRSITYTPHKESLAFGRVEGNYQSKFKQICLTLIGFEQIPNSKIFSNDFSIETLKLSQESNLIELPNYPQNFEICLF